ncbi:hypothetical protein EVAR_10255_1 [Eumeta japonica]|uniref:DUF5641 domain-containing protein n=1 Tax=Eumeta variegata TaxID=151549 RepID=A0A4C1TDQ0_EUMVA|nr:hypothetical protein EVAR_10255_1 [Eumeta japonica]
MHLARVDAFIINEITRELPTCEVDGSSLNIPNNISLADPKFATLQNRSVIRADIFWDLISLGQIKLGVNKPILQNSILGCHEIRRQLNKFWELEEVSLGRRCRKKRACEQHFVHTRRLPDGRFCVTLPLKIDPRQLGDSYYIAKKRLDSLEKRFHKQPDVKEHYLSFMREYEALGHSSKIERPKNAVFLPHHPVIKENSESTRCRVVFDASAKTETGLSLNDIMMVGPTVQDDIFSILIRLRQHKFVITADLEKMYRQILIEPSQRYLQMILWRENDHEPLNYLQLNTVTYGAFWCDSKIVLGWLKISPHKLSAFISHRVTEINNLCDSKIDVRAVVVESGRSGIAGVYPDELQSYACGGKEDHLHHCRHQTYKMPTESPSQICSDRTSETAFWTRWSREYVCELQQRPKWQHKQPDIKPDQMVLIRDDSTPPMKWRWEELLLFTQDQMVLAEWQK